MNREIRSPEVRLLDDEGNNVGIVKLHDAIKMAQAKGLDLVEITGKARPPIAKITDHGKHQYELNKLKKQYKEADKEKGKVKEETKHTQIKIGTGKDILNLRARKIREWLDDGHTVHLDLYLFGRYKSMDTTFLKQKLQEFLDTIEGEFTLADEIKKSPKGLSVVLHNKK